MSVPRSLIARRFAEVHFTRYKWSLRVRLFGLSFAFGDGAVSSSYKHSILSLPPASQRQTTSIAFAVTKHSLIKIKFTVKGTEGSNLICRLSVVYDHPPSGIASVNYILLTSEIVFTQAIIV